MDIKLLEIRRRLVQARRKLADDLRALDEVRTLLLKADEKRLAEPHEARKWNRVLANLEESLDHTRARCSYSRVIVGQLEQASSTHELPLEHSEVVAPLIPPEPPAAAESEHWESTLEKVGAL